MTCASCLPQQLLPWRGGDKSGPTFMPNFTSICTSALRRPAAATSATTSNDGCVGPCETAVYEPAASAMEYSSSRTLSARVLWDCAGPTFLHKLTSTPAIFPTP